MFKKLISTDTSQKRPHLHTAARNIAHALKAWFNDAAPLKIAHTRVSVTWVTPHEAEGEGGTTERFMFHVACGVWRVGLRWQRGLSAVDQPCRRRYLAVLGILYFLSSPSTAAAATDHWSVNHRRGRGRRHVGDARRT